MQNAVEVLKDYIEELFVMSEEETALLKENISVDLNKIKTLWQQKVNDVFAEATLSFIISSNTQMGGKKGNHSEHLTSLLAEMQVIQRTYPNSVW